MFKLFICFIFASLVTISFGQTNVYDCYINNIISVQQIESLPYEIQESCISFPNNVQYDFINPVIKKVTSTNRIHIENGFHFHPTQSNEELWLNINKCNNLTNVVCFTHDSLNSVEALKKIEFGIKLPDSIEQRIQQFISTGDTISSGINPYLSWQLDAKALFTNIQTGQTKTIHGFYFQDFKRDTTNLDKNLWTWLPINTSHHLRFRYAPEELGIWEVLINVKLKDSTNYTFCPFTINVIENTSNDGFVKVATNKRMLVRNEKLFFPIGTHIPWPDDSHLFGNNSAYRNTHTGSYPHVELQTRIANLKAEGVDVFRIILNPPSLDLEFEEVGNYTNRLNDGWEIDQIIEKAEELDMYVDFNMFVGYTLDIKSIYTRFGWDWGGDSILYAYPRSEGSFAYRERFNLPETEAKKWFTDEGCKKYYKQKIKYLISRYGYSTHISMFELFSEVNLAGWEAEVVYQNTDPNNLQIQMNILSNPYEADTQQPINIKNWHSEMAKFIKKELGHTEHLLAVSYAGIPSDSDSSYAIPEIDVMTHNSYSDNLGNRYFGKKFEIEKQFTKHHKPMILGETGPIGEYYCDATSSYRKSTWMHAFTGVAGFNMWEGQFDSEVWHHLADVRSFIEGNAEVADLWGTGKHFT